MSSIIEPPPAAGSNPSEVDPNNASSGLRSLAGEAYDQILTLILRGDLLPTENKPSSEMALQEQYDFGSRMPIRMALAVLASEGLVKQRARHGFWVVDYTDRDLVQIGAMRADADAMVASFLAASIGRTLTTESDDFQRVRRNLERMEDLAQLAREDNEPERTVDREVEMDFADYDTRFHTYIAEATDYLLAARHIRQWRNLVRLYRIRNNIRYTGQDLANICREHRNLLDLIGLSIEQCPDDIDDMIEEAATSHVEGSLRRCNVLPPLANSRQASPDRGIERLRQLKTAGVEDPNIDMVLAIVANDTAALLDALGRGADPNISLGEVLDRYNDFKFDADDADQ